jgi:histidine triad (HIT) family protein
MHPDQTTNCPFCRIALGQLKAHEVHASENVMAFLDLHPIRRGHVLIIPRKHFDYFDAIPPDIAHEVMDLGQRLAPALRSLTGVERVAFLFTGGDVPHAHAHLVPLVEATDITSRQYIVEERVTFQSAPPADPGELSRTAVAIRSHLDQHLRR